VVTGVSPPGQAGRAGGRTVSPATAGIRLGGLGGQLNQPVHLGFARACSGKSAAGRGPGRRTLRIQARETDDSVALSHVDHEARGLGQAEGARQAGRSGPCFVHRRRSVPRPARRHPGSEE